jgi:CHAT domain-containing protein
VAVLADPVFEADDPRLKLTPEKTTDHLEVRQALRDVGISPDGVEIPRLLASGAEADGIMAAAPWRTGLKAVGFAANRDRVLGPELSNYRIVHFATHGIINSERPELSGIVLSLFDHEGRPQNGFLRLHDIYNLRLPADLVVLSACSTGLGKDVRGEGLIGLTRGFMYAGASGVIASLWKVDDDATAELMKHFYAGLFKKDLSPAAALREAQLAVSQNKRWQSPYYWAGFVLQGQYAQGESFIEPFPNKTQVTLLATMCGLLLFVVILVTRRHR